MQSPSTAQTIITQQSFAVAPQLLGQPLAAPTRRAVAMLVDLLLLALLVNGGTLVFGLAAAYTLWRGSARPAGGVTGRFGRTWHLALRVGAVLFLFFFATSAWGGLRRRADAVIHPTQQVARAKPPAAQAEASEVEVAHAPVRTGRDKPRSAFSFLAKTADELGLGFGWAGLYFTAFLALWRGQTPGKRLVGIRVLRLDGKPLGWWASFERFGGYGASIFTGLLGFAQLLWDRNRQAMHDKISETVVVRV